jgi:hypothetical protein
MDKGELWKYEFGVLPANDGGFILTLGANYERHMKGEDNHARFAQQRWAFSNVGDLLAFLSSQVGPDPRACAGDE